MQNYPNPFNPETKIKFAINKNETASLIIYNELGEEIKTLFSGLAEAGKIYILNFDAGALTSGVYFYQLRAGNYSETKKMIVLR